MRIKTIQFKLILMALALTMSFNTNTVCSGYTKKEFAKDAKKTLLEQTFGILSTLAHEAGHASANYVFTGKFSQITLGFPDSRLEKLFNVRNIKFNNLGILGGYAEGNSSTGWKKVISDAAGPIAGATADFLMATVAEKIINKREKLWTKKILKKILDRAGPSLLNQLLNLLPLFNSDGEHIFNALTKNSDSALAQSAKWGITITGYFLFYFYLHKKVSAESWKRYNKYRIRPATLLFVGSEIYRQNAKKTFAALNNNPSQALSMAAAWFPNTE